MMTIIRHQDKMKRGKHKMNLAEDITSYVLVSRILCLRDGLGGGAVAAVVAVAAVRAKRSVLRQIYSGPCLGTSPFLYLEI